MARSVISVAETTVTRSGRAAVAVIEVELGAGVAKSGGWTTTTIGSLLLRVIYHYWYHIGEIMAIRQQLGHANLPEYIGDIDTEAPYRPE